MLQPLERRLTRGTESRVKTIPAAEELREIIAYDQETGEFRWRVARHGGVAAGDHAGSKTNNGYLTIMVGGRNFRCHRLAWLYVLGEWPEGDVDHINGIRTDNRWSNLRAATRSENLCNMRRRSDNHSGFKGVGWSGQKGKWRARIKLCGRERHLGFFDTAEEAHKSYVKAAAELHGEFARVA